MSNCFRFVGDNSIFLAKDEIKYDLFMSKVEKAVAAKKAPDFGEDYFFFMFLRMNVERTPNGVLIFFGEENRHTWRDWRGTVNVINNYMLCTKEFVFIVTDEADGFRTPGRLNLTLKPVPLVKSL